ncbi:MAG: hypothetical protein GY716_17915 [bacterium]|nr:hypothetical protein [bacterium]
MIAGFQLSCVVCHGGNPYGMTMEQAHVQPTLPPIMDKTVPPLDYDLPYQRFVNPSNLRVVEFTCGNCHWSKGEDLRKSMMATAAGHYAGGLYQAGVVESKTPIYGTFAVNDWDGDVPLDEGAVASLEDLVVYDPANDPSQYSTHFQAVPSQACARCHLWSRGKGYRGAENADGVYRADGCAACHMPYADDGLSQSADLKIDHTEPGHPLGHTITKEIPTFQCLHCHHRGARIGLSFTGRAQMPPRLPSGPHVPGTTDKRFNGNFHVKDPGTNPPDLHHAAGLHCIDCHTGNEIMGDGNIYGHMDQATKIECQTCHGMPTVEATLADNDGTPLNNVRRGTDGVVSLKSKISYGGEDGLPGYAKHNIPQVAKLVDPSSPSYNPRAACAMNDDHLKDEGGLECYSCHTSWTPNCFGCHFERDETQLGLNLMTREMEVGKASTNNKIFEALRYFMMGPNAGGKIAPYIVGCQPIADVTAPDGSKILDLVMPSTVNGVSGLALQPVHPHTVRGRGEVRTCAECHRAPPTLGMGSGNYLIERGLAFVVADGGVHVIDRSTDPRSPTVLGTLDVPTARAVAIVPNGVQATADYVIVAAGSAGLQVFDFRFGVPEDPVFEVPFVNASDLRIAGRWLYVIDEGVSVEIFDADDPTDIFHVAQVALPGAQRVVPWGIHLFVARGTSGLAVIEVADPKNPVLGGLVSGIDAADVALYAHYRRDNSFAARAYVADPGYGVRVLDLLPDFSAPQLIDSVALPGANSVSTYTRYLLTDDVSPSREHDYLHVSTASGLHVFDITEPAAIREVSALLDLGETATDLHVASRFAPPGVDDYALIADGTVGLHVLDVTDPVNPQPVTFLPLAGASRVVVEVQPLDRFIDEDGRALKENSHPGVETLTREDIVRILSADIAVDGSCEPDWLLQTQQRLSGEQQPIEFGAAPPGGNQ